MTRSPINHSNTTTRLSWSARSDRRLRQGFTLVEAVVATALTALAGTALLLGMTSALQTTGTALEQTIASGMAQQLMDEVVGTRYAAVGAGGYQTWFGPSSWELQGTGRERFNDIDDFHGLVVQPPEDLWGVELGTDDGRGDQRHPDFRVPAGYFDRWRQEVRVRYVRESDWQRLPYGQTSPFREVEVRIVHVSEGGARRELAKLQRVVSYVPPM
jgi:type II secretory pathway pseudopilin PulG